MDIARMNTRVVFQKNTAKVDKIGNHTSKWTDYFSCFATISGEGGKEEETLGLTLDNTDISFTVRYCNKVKNITTTGFRILWQGEQYNIVKVDHLNLRKRALKFKCQKEGRK